MEYSKIKTSALSLQPMVWRRLRAYLWGIETINSAHLFISITSVASLPMRNWNTYMGSKQAMYVEVASLPMRNWNVFVFFPFYSSSLSCEPTYEELKHKIVFFLLNLYIGCEPTYEELKRNDNQVFFPLRYSCEPTYEELKPYNNLDVGLISATLRAYLWGIETCTYSRYSLDEVSCEPTYEELKRYIWIEYWIVNLDTCQENCVCS